MTCQLMMVRTSSMMAMAMRTWMKIPVDELAF
jgi:hypothetical protein